MPPPVDSSPARLHFTQCRRARAPTVGNTVIPGGGCNSSSSGGGHENYDIGPSPPPPTAPLQPPPESPEGGDVGPSRQSSGGAAHSQAVEGDIHGRSGDGLGRFLRRWQCGWACLGGGGGSGSASGITKRSSVSRGSSKRRAVLRRQQLSWSPVPQVAGRSPLGSVAALSRKSNASTAAGQRRSSATGVACCDANANDGNSDSHVGPAPSQQMQGLQGTREDGGGDGGGGGGEHGADGTAAAGGDGGVPGPANVGAQAVGPGSSPPDPTSVYNPGSGGGTVAGPCAAGISCGGDGWGGGGPLAPSNLAAGSLASSIASYASGVTNTSRPSRWSVLAGLFSAGLRSFSQLAGIVEPDTGNLSLPAVHDLTRRAGRLDVARAAGQVFDLRLVGSGSVGLVYRGRLATGPPANGADVGAAAAAGAEGGRTVCVKYLVARGADGMAAPATEGLLSRALAHPNVISTYSWHVTRLTSDNFLELPEALAAMAAREQRKAAAGGRHGRRGGAAIGKGRRTGCSGSSGARHSPALATVAAVAAAAAAAASRRRPSSTMLQPTVILALSAGGDNGGCDGSFVGSGGAMHGAGGCSSRRKVSREASSTFMGKMLEMIRTSAATAAVSRTGPSSPDGSLLTRTLFSRRRSFTAAPAAACGGAVGAPAARGEAAAPLHLRASGASSDSIRRRTLAAPPLPSARQPQHHAEQQYQQHHLLQQSGPDPSQRTDVNVSWSAPGAEFLRTSDMASGSILQQAAASYAPIAALAAGGAAAAAAPGAGRGPSGFMTSLLSQDSASSHWLLASPSPSNHHVPVAGGSFLRITTCEVSGDGGGGVATADNSLILGTPTAAPPGLSLHPSIGTAAAGAPPPLQPPAASQPGTPVSIGGGAFPAGRGGRSTLVRVGSRLQFTTTPAQPSIPEDITQRLGQPMDVPVYGIEMSGTSHAVPSDTRDPAARLLNSSMLGEEALGGLPSIGASGAHRPLRVSAALPPPSTGAADTVESSLSGAGTGTGGGRSRSVESSCFLSQSDAQRPHALLQPMGYMVGEQQRRRADSGSGAGPGRVGLLAAALASAVVQQGPSTNHSQEQQAQSRGPSHSQGPTSPNGFGSGSGGLPPPAVRLQHAAGDVRKVRGGSSSPASYSRTASAMLTRSSITSTRHPGSTANLPKIVQVMRGAAAATGGGGTATPGCDLMATEIAVSSAIDISSSAGGWGLAAGGGGGGSAHGGAGGIGSSSISAWPSPQLGAATTTAARAGAPAAGALGGQDGAAAQQQQQQQVLERGWRTLQQIMQRLNARPGDYLTRIVMEDADQGSLQGALRSGRFGAEAAQLRTLLLTALDVARGMAFLHSSNIIHGDLKPSNILLCSEPTDPRGFVAKISDFGLSRFIGGEHDHVQNSREAFPAGTVRYLAPEAVGGASFKASDVWSYAVVLWQLATGQAAPWPGLRSMQVAMGVMQDELRLRMPPCLYPPLAHLIESCLAHDHRSRPTFDHIVEKLQAMLLDTSRLYSRSQPLAHAVTGTAASAAGPGCSHPIRQSIAAPEAPNPCPPGTAAPGCTAAAGTAAAAAAPAPLVIFQPVIAAAFLASPTIVPRVSSAAAPKPPTTSTTPTATTIAAVAAEATAGPVPAAATPAAFAAAAAPIGGLSTAFGSLDLSDGGGSTEEEEEEEEQGDGSPDETATELPIPQSGPADPDPDADPPSQSGFDSGASGAAATALEARAAVAAASAASGCGSLTTVTHCCSPAVTSMMSYTAAGVSSNRLSHMSGSWAHTGPLTGVTTTNATNAILTGLGLAVGSSSLLQLSRPLATSTGGGGGSLGQAGAGAGAGTGAGALALERQVVQDLYSRPCASLGTMQPDDLCGIGTTALINGGAASPLATSPFTHAGGGGGLSSVSRVGTAAAADFHQLMFLPPVHEEQQQASESGVQNGSLTHGSALSSGNGRLSAGLASTTTWSGDRRAATATTALSTSPPEVSAPGAAGHCGGRGGTGEGTLPCMLQSGLIMLRDREKAAGCSSSSSTTVAKVPVSARAPGSATVSLGRQVEQPRPQPLSQSREDAAVAAARQQGGRAVSSLDSLPHGVVADAYGRLSSRSG